MTDESPKSAAEAFEELRQEVALLRKAMQQLLNERQAPDYSQTLGKIMRDIKLAANGMTWLVNRPAIQVPAEELASRISAAGIQARRQDHETIVEAARTLSQATTDIDRQIAGARTAREQNKWLWRVGMSGAGAGVILGVIVACGLLHMFPEHGAAWILGMGRWGAGQHLTRSASTVTWQEIVAARTIYHDNLTEIKACRLEAEKTGHDQKCRLKVKAKILTP